MPTKKPAKPKKAKDIGIGKTKGAAVKGGARISKSELIKLQK